MFLVDVYVAKKVNIISFLVLASHSYYMSLKTRLIFYFFDSEPFKVTSPFQMATLDYVE